MVRKAAEALGSGEIAQAKAMLQDALENQDDTNRLWDEYHRATGTIKDLRGTEVKVAKELRLMVTAEQVTALLQGIYSALVFGTDKYIHDPRQQSEFLRYITGEIGRFANIGPIAINAQLGSGSKSES